MTFTEKQLTAILKVGTLMVFADGRVENAETMVVAQEFARLGVRDGERFKRLHNLSEAMSNEDMFSTITNMNYEQKKYVTAFLGVILAIDGNIDDKEMALWTLTSLICKLPQMNINDAIDYLNSL